MSTDCRAVNSLAIFSLECSLVSWTQNGFSRVNASDLDEFLKLEKNRLYVNFTESVEILSVPAWISCNADFEAFRCL